MANKSIIGIYNVEIDYKSYPYNKIVLGSDNFKVWIDNLGSDKIDPYVVKNNYSGYKNLYSHVIKDRLYLMQNTEGGLQISAILGSLIWRELEYNFGYELDTVSFWRIFQKFPHFLEYFDMTEEDIIRLAKKKAQYECDDFGDAIDRLVK